MRVGSRGFRVLELRGPVGTCGVFSAGGLLPGLGSPRPSETGGLCGFLWLPSLALASSASRPLRYRLGSNHFKILAGIGLPGPPRRRGQDGALRGAAGLHPWIQNPEEQDLGLADGGGWRWWLAARCGPRSPSRVARHGAGGGR